MIAEAAKGTKQVRIARHQGREVPEIEELQLDDGTARSDAAC